LKFSAAEIKDILQNVEFGVEINGETLTVAAPFWRTDIEIPEDIVEEVGRLHGFDKLPLVLPKLDLTPAEKDTMLEAKAAIRDRLSKAGANEVLTYSFVHGNLLEKTGQDKSKAFEISSALSPDLQYYRVSLMPSLLEKVHPNSKAGYSEFALFEMGKTHSTDHGDDDDGLPKEFEFTALVVTANNKLKKTGAPYYQAQKYLQALVDVELEFNPVSQAMMAYPVVQPYDSQRSALVSVKGGEFLGIIGEFKPSVRAALKLPNYTAGFELDTAVLQALLSQDNDYEPLPRFPSVKQDITLRVASDLAYQELFEFISSELARQQPKDTTPSLAPIDIYQAKDDKDHKNVTFRLSIASFDRTLTDTEVNKLLDSVAKAAKAKLNAERV
jgi:phenylalanyl-tRNA synthetase beta chain